MSVFNDLRSSGNQNHGQRQEYNRVRNGKPSQNSSSVDIAARLTIQKPQPHQGNQYNKKIVIGNNSIQINDKILSARNVEELIKILEDDFHKFSNVNVATFWNNLAKKEDSKLDDPRLQEAIDYTYEILPELGCREISNVIWGFANLGCENSEYYLKPFKDEIKKKLRKNNKFDGQNLANIAWSFATLEHKDPAFTKTLAHYIKPKLNDPDFFNGQNLASIAWAFEKLEIKDPVFIQLLTNYIKAKLNKPLFFNGLEIAIIALAFAKLEYKDPIFIQALVKRIIPKLNDPDFFSAQNIANIALAFARFGYKDPVFIQLLSNHIETKLKDPIFFSGQHLANIAWAFEKLEYKNPTSIHALAYTIFLKFNDPDFFSGIDLASISSSFVKLGYFNANFIQTLANRIIIKLNQPNFLDGQSLANIAWSFAKLEFKNPILIQAIANRITPNLINPTFFNAQNIANIMWSFAKLEYKNPIFTQAIVDYTKPKLNDLNLFNAQELANIEWAYIKLEYTDPQFIQTLISRLGLKLSDPNSFDGQELASIAYSLCKLEFRYPKFTKFLAKSIEQKLDQNNPNFFSSQGIVNMAWSFVMICYENEHPDFVLKLLNEINNRFENGTLFKAEELRQLLQIREILPIESPEIDIPWCNGLNKNIDLFKKSLKRPVSSELHNDVELHLKKVLDQKNCQYEIDKEKYELGFYIDNLVSIDDIRIAFEVCGPCHYYLNKPEIPLPELQIKQRILHTNGTRTVVVPYFIWYKLSNEEKDKFLLDELERAINSPLNIPDPINQDEVCAILERVSVENRQLRDDDEKVDDGK